MTRGGLRALALSVAPVGVAMAVASLLFFSRPQPGWLQGLFALFVLGGVGVLYRVISLWTARRRIVKEGVAASATVVAKTNTRRGGAAYYCWYEAGGKQWGLGWSGDWRDAEIGDMVTVLHSAEDPSQAVAYRWAGCEAVTQPDRSSQSPDEGHSPLKPKI